MVNQWDLRDPFVALMPSFVTKQRRNVIRACQRSAVRVAKCRAKVRSEGDVETGANAGGKPLRWKRLCEIEALPQVKKEE